ncbi:MAG TPA: FAD-binding oxidoreductase, partial [Thermomicrobiales bacterium]|nr:FAD-binding oxidoreductase [Thermomicrobiales bacterium]
MSTFSSSQHLSETAISDLRAQLRGDALVPGDGRYNDARTLWNAMIDRRPAVIAQCTGVADVLDALAFARSNDLSVAIRAGGHNVAGTALCDGGLVIDLTRMKGIRVDPASRRARVEGGVTWGELDRETQVFGLATTGGVIPSTGVTGLTLGGGIGWLMRKHGLSCDNLISADVVTADGRLVTASADEHSELFWGLRGGGGNFGVVTSMEFQLHEVGPDLVAGPLFYPREQGRDAFRFARDRAASQPDELICHLGVVTAPDGAQLSALIPVYVGPIPDGERAIEPLRQFGPPAADMAGPIPYLSLQSLFNAAYPTGLRNYWKAAFIGELPDDLIDLMVESYAGTPSPYAALLLEQCGGAVNRVGASETAFPHRNAAYNVVITTAWDDPSSDERNIQWVRDTWNQFSPFLDD